MTLAPMTLTPKLAVRRARAEERASLTAFAQRSVAGLAPSTYAAEVIARVTDRQPPANVPLVDPEAETLVLESDGRTAGLVSFAKSTAAKGRITGLYVLPELARCGIGTLLIGEAERALRARGARHIEITASLNAMALLSRLGYRPARVERESLGGSVVLMTVLMGKAVQESALPAAA